MATETTVVGTEKKIPIVVSCGEVQGQVHLRSLTSVKKTRILKKTGKKRTRPTTWALFLRRGVYLSGFRISLCRRGRVWYKVFRQITTRPGTQQTTAEVTAGRAQFIDSEPGYLLCELF